jgi:hypothetical protein
MVRKLIVAPRIDPEAHAALTELFETANAGALFACEAWPRIMRRTLTTELKGMFTEAELRALMAAARNLSEDTGLAGERLRLALEGADTISIARKLEALSTAQRAVLEVWAAYAARRIVAGGSGTKAIERSISDLAAPLAARLREVDRS